MWDIHVEITEKGYNDGKPFVPIVELAKQWIDEEIKDYLTLNVSPLYIGIRASNPDFIFAWWLEDRCFGAWYSGWNDVEAGDDIELRDTHKIYDLLHAWHFDYRGLIEQGDAVNIHDLEKNPYEN